MIAPVRAPRRPLADVGLAFLALLALAAAATFYWAILRGPELAARPDNPRRIALDQATQRGRILDRRGTILAETRFETVASRRIYPVPEAAPVVGYQTWRFGAGAGAGASYGTGGAEAAYDVALRGDLGRSVAQIAAASLFDRPRQGHDVVLTLDAELQRQAAARLGGGAGRSGAAVILRVGDGAVRALASTPAFDPAALDDGAELPAAALLNRATQGLYPPGSVWKAVTLAAAIQAGIAREDDERDDGSAVETFDGFAVRCNNAPEGAVRFDLLHAFAYSCNVTFARLGAALGAERYRAAAAAFGLGEAPPFPLPTAAGSLSSDDALTLPELASAAFGQGELLVSPLHMALVAAAIAGDGALPAPYLLADVPGVRWSSIADERGTWRQAMSRGVAASTRRAMVVSARDGWARSAGLGRGEGFTFGGKTGTAETGGSRPPHAWFIGFAPADEPTVAVAVLVEHGGDGATAAAPIGGALLEAAARFESEGRAW